MSATRITDRLLYNLNHKILTKWSTR
jgi:hypothetical protein